MLKRISALLLVAAAFGCTSEVPQQEAGRSLDPEMVLNKMWQWTSTVTPGEEVTVTDPERYTALLGDDGKLQGKFDCNSGGGDYTIGEGTLSFGPLFTTRVACQPESLGNRFIEDLQKVRSFYVEDGNLYLELEADGGTMRFRAAD